MSDTIKITTALRDLDRLVAMSAFCPEPPASERRAIHQSGAWRWVSGPQSSHCATCFQSGMQCARCAANEVPYWEPAHFSTDPAASYALRQKMRADGWQFAARDVWHPDRDAVQVNVTKRSKAWGPVVTEHSNECTAMALAALRALGVKFELVEGWDK